MIEPPTERAKAVLASYGEPQHSTQYYYVTIHPLADEVEILANLGMAPDDCVAVDAYWALGNDVVFVSVWGTADAEPMASYCGSNPPVAHRFYVRTSVHPLTSATFETILSELRAWLMANPDKWLHKDVVVFADYDLATVKH